MVTESPQRPPRETISASHALRVPNSNFPVRTNSLSLKMTFGSGELNGSVVGRFSKASRFSCSPVILSIREWTARRSDSRMLLFFKTPVTIDDSSLNGHTAANSSLVSSHAPKTAIFSTESTPSADSPRRKPNASLVSRTIRKCRFTDGAGCESTSSGRLLGCGWIGRGSGSGAISGPRKSLRKKLTVEYCPAAD